MTISAPGTRSPFAFVRVLLLAGVPLMLGACETDSIGPSAADAPKAGAVATARTETPKTQAAKPAAEPAADAEPMTHARAARECWMSTEKGNPHQDLDKRADVVDKCIEQKMKAAAGPAPKT